jgi:hypothetical protein
VNTLLVLLIWFVVSVPVGVVVGRLLGNLSDFYPPAPDETDLTSRSTTDGPSQGGQERRG